MRLSHLPHIAAIAAIAVALAACSGGSTSTSTTAPSTATATASPVAGGSSATAVEVTVKLTDALKMEPASISVKAGVPVRFVVTNSGATDHEFFLGDEAAQMGHGQEMSAMPGMNDGHAGIGLKAGETKTLEYTFAKAGSYLAGCHVNGHYEAGMMATVTVTE